jgi:hypothetical protein
MFIDALLLGSEEFQAYALQVVAQYQADSDTYADAAKRIVIAEVHRSDAPKSQRDTLTLSRRLAKAEKGWRRGSRGSRRRRDTLSS